MVYQSGGQFAEQIEINCYISTGIKGNIHGSDWLLSEQGAPSFPKWQRNLQPSICSQGAG